MSDAPDYHAEGFDDWLAGRGIETNPHPDGTTAAMLWEAGWLEAEEMA